MLVSFRRAFECSQREGRLQAAVVIHDQGPLGRAHCDEGRFGPEVWRARVEYHGCTEPSAALIGMDGHGECATELDLLGILDEVEIAVTVHVEHEAKRRADG